MLLSGVAIEIASRALAGRNRFDTRLDPPELGRIEVRLTSIVTAESPRSDAAGLQSALQDAGLKTDRRRRPAILAA